MFLEKYHFKPLELKDKDQFDKCFAKQKVAASEITFTNLFTWSKHRPIYLSFEEDGVLIATSADGGFFLPPLGFSDRKKAYDKMCEIAQKENFSYYFKRIPEADEIFIKNASYSYLFVRDQFDYIYLVEDLYKLEGKLSKKRVAMDRFVDEFGLDIRTYDESYRQDLIDLATSWVDERQNDPSQAKDDLEDELDAILKTIDNIKQLKVDSLLLFADDELIGFSFGEKFCDDTYVVHFEKTDLSLKGAYQTICFAMVKTFMKDKFVYINREQDLGIEGLRRAKLSCQPIMMWKKIESCRI